MMLTSVLALLVLFPAPLPPQDAGADEQVGATIKALDEAFAGGDEDAQLDAIHAATEIDSPDVAAKLAAQIGTKNRTVKAAVISALGYMSDPAAVKALQSLYDRDKPLREDEGLFVTLLTALGRQGAPSSVPYLLDKPFNQLTLETGRARIFALGNIRTRESVEGLIKGMRLGGPSRNLRLTTADYPFMPYFRVALIVLTGADQGADKEAWQEWWRKNQKTFEISPERPPVYAWVRHQWEDFWGEPYSVQESATSPAMGNPPTQFTPVPKPTEEQVTAALKALDDAFKGDDELAQTAAIEEAAPLIDPRIAKSIARGCKSRSPAVVVEAIDALGWMHLPEALTILQDLYKRDVRLKKDDYLLPRLIKAIGRYGDPSTVPLLADKSFRTESRAAVVARILSLARIRSKDSVAAIMKGMSLGPSETVASGRPARAPRYMNEVAVALQILTGQNLGPSKLAWQNWWAKNQKTFEMPPKPEELPAPVRESLEEYWGEPYSAQ